MIIEKTSPLSTGERAKLSFADKAGAENLIRSKGYEPATYQGKRYAVKEGRAYPLDEAGFSMGDIGDIAAPAVDIGVSTLASIPATMAGPAGWGASAALGTTAKQGVGKALGVSDWNPAEVAVSGAVGAALPIVGKFGSKTVSKLATGAKTKVTEKVVNPLLKKLGLETAEQVTGKATKVAESVLKKTAPAKFKPDMPGYSEAVEKYNDYWLKVMKENKFTSSEQLSKYLDQRMSDLVEVGSQKMRSIPGKHSLEDVYTGLLKQTQKDLGAGTSKSKFATRAFEDVKTWFQDAVMRPAEERGLGVLGKGNIPVTQEMGEAALRDRYNNITSEGLDIVRKKISARLSSLGMGANDTYRNTLLSAYRNIRGLVAGKDKVLDKILKEEQLLLQSRKSINSAASKALSGGFSQSGAIKGAALALGLPGGPVADIASVLGGMLAPQDAGQRVINKLAQKYLSSAGKNKVKKEVVQNALLEKLKTIGKKTGRVGLTHLLKTTLQEKLPQQ